VSERPPIVPFEVRSDSTVKDILEAMEHISFQARMLGAALRIWREMLTRDVYIFFGLAGAMIPAGMRKVLVFLIENGCLDALVSTGANLFHDLHETLGRRHYAIDPKTDDRGLRQEGLDRIYDTCAPDAEFTETDRYIMDFADALDSQEPITTARFFALLGDRADRDKKEEGIITAAWRAGVPIFCPALADSSYGIALSMLAEQRGRQIVFDVVADVTETARLAASRRTGVIFVGGGTPKNFVQQTEVTAALLWGSARGHEYAIQITTDSPHWGGLSGCTFEEAQSWGKIAPEAKMVTVHCDGTIALPLLATALAQARLRRKKRTRSQRP
jgi:deoxyhypusine synthase